MHRPKCWTSDAKSTEDCLKLIKMTEGKDRHYDAKDLMDKMHDVHNSMIDRHCFTDCFRRAFLYHAIDNRRSDLVALLSSDKRCLRNSTNTCDFLSVLLLKIMGNEKVQVFCGERSPLHEINVNRLCDVICQDLQAAIESAYVNGKLDLFSLFVDNYRKLNRKR